MAFCPGAGIQYSIYRTTSYTGDYTFVTTTADTTYTDVGIVPPSTANYYIVTTVAP